MHFIRIQQHQVGCVMGADTTNVSVAHTIDSVHQTKKMILCMMGKRLCYS
jgi:hypothetical protein